MKIIRTSDGKVFTESDLHILLAEEGETKAQDSSPRLAYNYSTHNMNQWSVLYDWDTMNGYDVTMAFLLDPAKYQCIPDTCIRKEEVYLLLDRILDKRENETLDTDENVDFVRCDEIASAFARILET